MTLSVLLPTRNGGRQLEGALRSVIDQDVDDLEIVVSDNASDEVTREVIASFAGDPRLKVVRLEESVGVAENWTNSLRHSTGSHLLMIGDDDFLLPGACARVNELLGEYGPLDALTYEAYAYAFPGTLPGSDESAYADPLHPPDPSLPARGLIPPATRREIALDVFRLTYRFGLTMQTTVFSRAVAEAIPGGPFKPPFPDFYLITALLLRVERWAYAPDRLVIVGVSPKSFGRTIHHGGRDSAVKDAGLSYLGISTDFDGHLPGNELISGTWVTLKQLQADLPEELRGVEPSRDQYVAHMVYAWYQQYRLGWLSRSGLVALLRGLSPRDYVSLSRGLASRVDLAMLRKRLFVNRSEPAAEFMPGMRPLPGVTDISELAARVSAG